MSTHDSTGDRDLGRYGDRPAARMIDILVCGCAAAVYDATGHEHGCWMVDVEAIATQALDTAHDVGGNGVLAVIVALADHGYLRDVDPEVEYDAGLWGLIDELAQQRLIVPPATTRHGGAA